MVGVETVILHRVSVGGGVDELAVTHIDPHMGYGGGDPAVVEEDQIAGLKLAAGDRDTVGQLGAGGTVQGIAEVSIDILGKAGAVKAVGAVAAPDIGPAQKLLGVLHHLNPQRGGGGGDGIISPRAGGVFAGDHIVAGDIACGAAVGNFIPTVVHAVDGDHRAGVEDGDQLAVGTGTGADIQGGAVGLDHTVTDGHVSLGGNVQIFAGHIAFDGEVVHLIPVVFRLFQNHHGIPQGGGGQNGGFGVGLGPEAESIGGDGAGPYTGGGSSHHTESRQNTAE